MSKAEGEAKEFLLRLISEPRLSSRAIKEIMHDRFAMEIGDDTVGRHRRGSCSCPKS